MPILLEYTRFKKPERLMIKTRLLLMVIQENMKIYTYTREKTNKTTQIKAYSG